MRSFFEGISDEIFKNIDAGISGKELINILNTTFPKTQQEPEIKELSAKEKTIIAINKYLAITNFEQVIKEKTTLAWCRNVAPSDTTDCVIWPKNHAHIHAKIYRRKGVGVVECNGSLGINSRIFAGFFGLVAIELGKVSEGRPIYITQDTRLLRQYNQIVDETISRIIPDKLLARIGSHEYWRWDFSEVLKLIPIPGDLLRSTLNIYAETSRKTKGV